jgi:hypothetical protein
MLQTSGRLASMSHLSGPRRPSAGRGFVARMRFPTETVRVIRNEGTDDEETFEVVAHIQPKSGFFDIDTPIYEGDIVEVADPRGGPDGRARRLAQLVEVNNNAPRGMEHIEVKWRHSTLTSHHE